MKGFWILILVPFFATKSLDKAESVQLKELEELPLQTFDELFVDEWWDKDEAENLKTPAPSTNFGQSVHHQIDRQNTPQLGQIELNSTDQNAPLTESNHSGQIEPNSTDQNASLTESGHSGQIPNSTDQNAPLTESGHSGQIPNSTDQNAPLTESDHLGQIELNSTDQNPPLTESDHLGQIELNSTDQNTPLTESDHSDNAKNAKEQNEVSSSENIAEDDRKRKIIDKFQAIKDEFKQKGKFPYKERTKIEDKIAKHLQNNLQLET
uniref:Uncharacterized protein n=1 Tax=Globodera rostochiensis TaxID=31243 RepID=A0A914HKV5_GLORO